MPRHVLLMLIAAAALFSPAVARPKVDRLPPSTGMVLDNGFEAVLIPNHAAPLATSVVVVRCGSAREGAADNGVSHMLEHLLFNGTARRTQQQIADEQDRYGIVNNAQTGTGHTSYFVMATREMFGRALDLQADMLFGSTFPEELLPKEREIILNEIARERANQEASMSDLLRSRLYHASGLALPTIGSEDSVRAISRAAILEHYRRWYVPNNMTAVIMGDFEPEEIEPLVQRYFGAAPPGLVQPSPPPELNRPALGLTHARRAEGSTRRVWLGAPAPGIGSGSYAQAHLVASLLGEGLRDAAAARLAAAAPQSSLVEAGSDLDIHGPVATVRVWATLDGNTPFPEASRALLAEVVARLEASSWTTQDLDRLRLEEKAALMRLWEKPHYFGLDRAPVIAEAGWVPARDFVRNLGWVEPADLKQVAKSLADPKGWAVFNVGPDAPDDVGVIALAGGRSPEDKVPLPPTTESRDLVARWKGPPPPPSGSAPAGLSPRLASILPAEASVNVRTVLPNGITVNMDSADDSRVFAAHVLVKGRSAAEPAGRSGIAELLHMMAGRGTRSHPGAELKGALRAIGGTIKVTDDAGIPYDDIYLSPEYSYIRLEALDEFAPQALELLREILSEPVLDGASSLAQSREQLLARARQDLASPRERCRLLVAQGLWGKDHPFSSPLFGTEESIRSITPADLAAFHKTYFAPRNLILGIGTSHPPERILPVLEKSLGHWSLTTGSPLAGRESRPTAPPPAGAPASGLLRERLDSAQSYIMQGHLVSSGPTSLAAFEAFAAVLGRRMTQRLREERGLAYLLGAEATPIGGQVQLTASMGVLPDSVEEARGGLRQVLLSMSTSPPSPREVEDAVRHGEVRSLMRGLSRINRAHGRCLEELRRGRSRGGTARGPSAAPASTEQLTFLTGRLLKEGALEGWIEAVAGRWDQEASR